MKEESKIRQLFNSKTLTITVLALIVLLVLAFFRDKVRQEDLTSELGKKESDIVELESERIRLAEMVDILESSDYIEREARLRLGLVKPGEKVISVPDGAMPHVASTTIQIIESRGSNARQWFEYFFPNS